MSRMIHYFCIVTLVVNFSFLFTFAAALGAVSFKVTGLLSLLVLFVYCADNKQILFRFVSCWPVLYVIFFYSLLPWMLSFLTPIFPLRFIGYNLLGLLLLLSTAIFVGKEGVDKFGKVIFITWLITGLGLVLSVVSPGVFKGVAAMQEEVKGTVHILQETKIGTANQSRAFGFYMQPNRAAYALVLFAVILSCTYFRKLTYWRYFFLAVTLGLLLLTGSRGGLLQFAVLLFFIMGNEIISGIQSRAGVRSFSSVVPALLLFGAVGVGGYFIVNQLTGGGFEASMLDRVFNLFRGGGQSVLYDGSVQHRLRAQEVYIDAIISSPFLGHGLAANIFHQNHGFLPLSSHNAFFEYAFNYGIPAALCLWLGLIVIGMSRSAVRVRQILHYNLPLLLALLLVVSSMVVGGAIYSRFYSVTLGMWLSLQYLCRPPEPRPRIGYR